MLKGITGSVLLGTKQCHEMNMLFGLWILIVCVRCAVSNEEEGRGEERKKRNFSRTDIRKKSGQREPKHELRRGNDRPISSTQQRNH
eukprot:scaffold27055_cov155-Skeletonema_menzelii.AAC.7